MALSGGFRYSPTTSVSFSRNRGSRDSLNVFVRCGLMLWLFHRVPTVDLLIPWLAAHQPATPVSAALRLRLQRGVDHRFDAIRTIHGLTPAARRDVPQTRQSLLSETLPPQADGFAIYFQSRGNGGFRFTVGCGKDNSAP